MKVQISSVLLLLIGVTVAFPTKEREIDELIFRLQELKHRNGAANYGRNLDQLGGGNIVRNLDSLGGGNLVRNLDPLGGGNLVRNLDSLGGGNLVRNLDSLGGGNLVRNLDSLGGGNLVRNLDSLGGGNLVRNLDSLGGGNLVRNLDSLGGGNLVRNLDSLGGGNLVRELDWNVIRSLDSLGGGNLVRSARPYEDLPQFNIRSLDSIGGEQSPGSIGPHTSANIASQQQYQKTKKPVDLDIAPLLYDYYATGIAPSLDEYNNQKRFDEIDRFGFDTLKRQIGDMRTTQYIDSTGRELNDKRAHSIKSRRDGGYGGGFDEIDRINFGGFY